MRKHGQTNVEYIRVLESRIKNLETKLIEANKINDDLINHRNIVSLDRYNKLTQNYQYLVERLKSMNLWTGL